MVFAYFDRLSAGRQRIYLASDAIESLALPQGVRVALALRASSRRWRRNTEGECAQNVSTWSTS